MKLFGDVAIDTNIVVEAVYDKILKYKFEKIRYGDVNLGMAVTLKNDTNILPIYKSEKFMEQLSKLMKTKINKIDTNQRGVLYSVYLFIEGLN